MYLFTRRWLAEPGEFVKALEWSAEVTGRVREVTGRDVNAYTAVMSPEVGTVVWSMWAEHLTEIEAAGDALAADAGYRELVERGSDYFDGPVQDGLAQLVHGTLDADAGPPAYVTGAFAVAANGRLGNAISSGIEIADHATRVSGQNTLFIVNGTGAYGGVAWITPGADLQTLETGEAKLMADPAWLELLNRVGTDYQAGVTQTIFRRIS